MEQSDTVTSTLEKRVHKLTLNIDDIKESHYGEVVFIKNLEEKEESQLFKKSFVPDCLFNCQ